MPKHPAYDMLWVARYPRGCDGMPELMHGIAVVRCPINQIHEVRGMAKLHPLIVQRVVGGARPTGLD